MVIDSVFDCRYGDLMPTWFIETFPILIAIIKAQSHHLRWRRHCPGLFVCWCWSFRSTVQGMKEVASQTLNHQAEYNAGCIAGLLSYLQLWHLLHAIHQSLLKCLKHIVVWHQRGRSQWNDVDHNSIQFTTFEQPAEMVIIQIIKKKAQKSSSHKERQTPGRSFKRVMKIVIYC